MIALSCNHKNHKQTLPHNDYCSYAGSDALLLIRSHGTKIEMQAFLSKNEEYKSAKKFGNSIKNRVMQKISIDIQYIIYTKAIKRNLNVTDM